MVQIRLRTIPMITAEICSQMEKCLISMTISEGWNRKKSGYHYYHLDEQNSTAYITGGNGEIENRYEYDAFGVLKNSMEELTNRILYTGQQYDQISGQYYLRARYYNPVVGRFLQEDVYRGDGLNLYAYCKNNPVVYYDPSGYDKNKRGDFDFAGKDNKNWVLTPNGDGAHLIEKANIEGRINLKYFKTRSSCRYYPEGSIYNAGAAHQRLHKATSDTGINLKGLIMEELYVNINELVQDLLIPARVEKK